MSAESDIAAISDGGENTAADVRQALTSVLGRADAGGAGFGVQVVEIADAAPKTIYHHGPQAVYDPASDRTYIAFLGEDRDLYVTFYDHQDGTVATPVKADDRVIAANDAHSSPTICVDTEGHIQIVWGSHNTAHRHVRSDSPHDISAWTGQNIGTGTYPHIVCHRATGDLYVFYRAGSSHGSNFPSHEFEAMQKSTDGGSTWAAAVEVIDASDAPENATDVYVGGVREADDGRFHLAWLTARGASHDATRQDVYHAIYDPADGHLYTAGGVDLGETVTWADHSDCLVESIEDINKLNLTLDGERVLIAYGFRNSGSDAAARVAIWDGSWTVRDTGVPQADGHASFAAVYPIKNSIRLLVSELVGSDHNLTLHGAPSNGTHWHQLDTLAEDSVGVGFVRVSPVPGGGPSAGIAQEDAANQADTSATESDLLPLYLIIDPAHYAYQSEVTGDTEHVHDSRYYTQDEVDALIDGIEVEAQRYEVILTGSGNTLEPVTNEAEDDWLYGLVS